MNIKSFGEFDAKHMPANHIGRIHFRNVQINASSTDKALLKTEASIITRYAWESYDGDLLRSETIDPTSSVWNNYYNKSPNGYHELKEGLEVHKQASDVLGVVEFFINRFNSLSDEQIKAIMVSSRCYIRSVKGENNRKGLKKNRLKISGYETKDGGEPKLWFGKSKDASFDFAELFGRCKTIQQPETKILDERFEDLFVLLKDDNEELVSIYREFWQDNVTNGCVQLDASSKYIPLGYLLGKLESTIEGLERGHPFRYAIESDLRSAEMGIVHPLDSFLGPIGDRDRDFESSDSDIRLIAKASPDYLRSIATYARLVHTILLESIVENMTLKLAFNADSMIRLCDPVLINRSYPPLLRFTPDAESIIIRYRETLRSMGYLDADAYDMIRTNPKDDLAPEWSEVIATAEPLRDRMNADTPIAIRTLTDKVIAHANSDQFHSIIISTEEEREACEQFISTLSLPRSVSFLVFPSDEHYIEKRYDLFGITEVGVTSSEDLLNLHRNNIDRKRRQTRNELNKYLEGKELDRNTIIGKAFSSLITKSDEMEKACRNYSERTKRIYLEASPPVTSTHLNVQTFFRITKTAFLQSALIL